MKRLLQQFWWYLNGLCIECGGTIIDYSARKAFCEDCNARY